MMKTLNSNIKLTLISCCLSASILLPINLHAAQKPTVATELAAIAPCKVAPCGNTRVFPRPFGRSKDIKDSANLPQTKSNIGNADIGDKDRAFRWPWQKKETKERLKCC